MSATQDRQCVQQLAADLCWENAELRQEVARLREALERIADGSAIQPRQFAAARLLEAAK